MAKKKSGDQWWAEVEAAPREKAASVAKVGRNYRIARWAVIGVLLWTPLVTVAAAASVTQNRDVADSLVTASAEPGRAEATVAVQLWLTGVQSPLPGGQVVAYEGADVVPWTTQDKSNSGDLPAYDIWVHRFAIADAATAALYTAEVRVSVSQEMGVLVVSSPSLTPVAKASSELTPELRWPGWVNTSASPSVKDALSSWVRAYTSGDATALRLAVGDPDPAHAYVPLAGIDDADVEIRAAASIAKGTAAPGTDPLVLAVTVLISRDGPLGGQGGSRNEGARFDIDLLVVDASTAAPRIVAWGGPGTGSLLVPYQNAVRPDRAGATAPAVPPPSPSPSSQPSPSATVSAPRPNNTDEAMD